MRTIATEDTAIPTPPLALVPLDDRPCNRQFPSQLAEIVGLELHQPPREALGWFTTPGNCEAIAAWLRESPAAHLVLSLDMLCYGGLVASRAPETGAGTALARLEGLRALKQARPDLIIFASSVIPRLGLTVAAAGDLRSHQDLIAYATHAASAGRGDRLVQLGEPDPAAEVEAIAARLDPQVLTRYLAVRERNHAVSRRAVELVAEGVLAYLLVVQEDAAPEGLHVAEQEDLRQLTAARGVGDRVELHPGADEAGLVLLARHCSLASGAPPRLCADYASDQASRGIPLYEDRPLRDTVLGTLRAAGAQAVPPMQAEAMMFVHTPLGDQREASEAPPQGHSPSVAMQAESIVERLHFATEAGGIAGIADVMYANGGDPELIAALERSAAGKKLRAYAGWNTASNTVGTVVAQLCLEALAAREKRPVVSRRFLACRLADDYGYQTVVRPQAIQKAAALNADQFALGAATPQLEEHVRARLLPVAESALFGVLGAPLRDLGPELKVSLPWRRLFEVEVEIPPAAAP